MRTFVCFATLLAAFAGTASAADPVVDTYLREGRLADGAKALEAQLTSMPKDDSARFSLGVVRFLQAFEHLGGGLYRYGLRTDEVVRIQFLGADRLIVQNPKPEKISYTDLRKMLQTWVDDLAAADAELANVSDKTVKLPLHIGQAKVDLLGQGTPISAAFLLGRAGNDAAQRQAEELVIAFDHGDVIWLRGYLNILAAWGELLLAVDGQEMFDTTAHLFFEKVDSPHAFLQEGDRAWDARWWNNRALITDVIAWLHTMRFPIKDPAKMKAVLTHLETTAALGQEMWKSIEAETDDDREWIPNPKQTGVMRTPVTKEMITTWTQTLAECEQILKGKKLIPFWRGTNADRGVNLRRVFTEPRTVDPFLWLQGTAATPYLETGPITQFVDREFLQQIDRSFGSNFVGFAFWFQ